MSRRTKAAFSLLVGASVALVALGCSGLLEYPKAAPEDTKAACGDGVDNDLDGRADCYDSGCAAFCGESSAETCKDGKDNDFDGRTDCFDPHCKDYCQESSDAACHDGKDNDGNGVLDCGDPACTAVCQENTSATCSDGLDNDADKATDCHDQDCKAFCPESDKASCSDRVDNDFDGRTDCEDTDCDGFCPEENAKDCSDGRDNDGDGLKDALDARCWPFAPPAVQRCGAGLATEFAERFDEPAVLGPPFFTPRWFEFGQYRAATGSLTPVVGSGHRNDSIPAREDSSVFFGFNVANNTQSLSNNLGGMSTTRTFTGEWAEFELDFDAMVLVNSVARVALVPTNLAPLGEKPRDGAETALLAAVLDTTTNPPLFALDVADTRVSTPLPAARACGLKLCDGGWVTVSVRYEGGQLLATLSGAGGNASLKAPGFDSQTLPESRLVVWGGSTAATSSEHDSDFIAPQVDDLRLRLTAPVPCGVAVPQVPYASCQATSEFRSVGHTVSLARGDASEYCALATASAATSAGGPSIVTAWTSKDGFEWGPATPAASVFTLPAGAVPVGAGIAEDGKRFFAAVAYKKADGVVLGLANAATCAGFAELTPGPVLPADAGAPSYVIANGKHEIYFTRPATDQTARTLWRASGKDQSSITVEPAPLAELPKDSNSTDPVSVSRVGASDLVMTYRTQPGSGISGIGVLVGDGSGRNWQTLSPVPYLAAMGGGAFDGDGVTAAALIWTEAGGFFLYGGLRNDRISVGTALLSAKGRDPVLPAPGTIGCGNGTCEEKETCESCPADCTCTGLELLATPLARASGWTVTSDSLSSPDGDAYVDPGTHTLDMNGLFGSLWSALPLPGKISGDFRLSFELTVSKGNFAPANGTSCDPFLIGLGSLPTAANLNPAGAFARLSYVTPCLTNTFGLSPFVRTDSGVFRTMGYPSFATCRTGFSSGDLEAKRRVALTRRGHTVETTIYGESGCPESDTIDYDGSLPDLEAVVVGFGETHTSSGDCQGMSFEVSDLSLKLASDPSHCAAGETACGTGAAKSCVDTSTSAENCGKCGATCAAGRTCVKSACQCAPGLLDCGGTCIDPETSGANCGTCGNACASYCLFGTCDSGATCSSAPAIPAGSGRYQWNLRDRVAPADTHVCFNSVAERVVLAWQPLRAGPVAMVARGASTDMLTALGVTTDPTCENFDFCEQESYNVTNFAARVEFQAVAGKTYYIAVGISDFDNESERSVELEVEAP